MKPEVSVCIPVYNHEMYLAKCIQSVLEQSFQDFEVFVVDDCSIDRSVEIAKSFDDPRIHLMRNTRNLGLAGNWNKCVSITKSKFVQILHADDFLLRDHLKLEYKMISNDERIGYVHSACWIVDDRDQAKAVHKPFPSDFVVTGSEAFKEHIFGNYVACPTVLVRRECYTKLGAFDPKLFFALDWDMWLRIELAGYRVGYLARPQLCYRFGHKKAATTFALKSPAWLVFEEYKALRKTLSDSRVGRIADPNNLSTEVILRHVSSRVYYLLRQLREFHDPIRPLLQLMYWVAIAKKMHLLSKSTCMIVYSLILALLHGIGDENAAHVAV